MRIKVLFFAAARERAGLKQDSFDIEEGSTTEQLRAAIIERYPGVQSVIAKLALAVNLEYIDGEVTLQNNDEVALIPPISGG